MLRATLGLALLAATATGCMRMDHDPLPSFSNCYKSRMTVHVNWCLQPSPDRNFHHAVGRHYIIYGRYNDDPDLVKEGVSRCQIDQDGQRDVNACTPAEVMDLAAQALPEDAAGSYCEASVDPRHSLWDC